MRRKPGWGWWNAPNTSCSSLLTSSMIKKVSAAWAREQLPIPWVLPALQVRCPGLPIGCAARGSRSSSWPTAPWFSYLWHRWSPWVGDHSPPWLEPPHDSAFCFPGEFVAQFKFTVLLMPNGPMRITSGPFEPELYKSEFEVQDAELKVSPGSTRISPQTVTLVSPLG